MSAVAVNLALFDLDHTLLDGDTDQLWCSFLVREGLLDGATFAARNEAMARGYRAGTVGVAEFCGFYIGTLAGFDAAHWEPLRRRFVAAEVAPRLGRAAHALVARHRDAGDQLVLTTATNRFLTEPTAALLGIEELIATDCELDAGGRFTGRAAGVPNMRQGKVQRLAIWLAERGLELPPCNAIAYSDSINDLPLLAAVARPVAVDPDPQLAAEAARRGWPVISLR